MRLKPPQATISFPRMFKAGMLSLPFKVGFNNFRRFLQLTNQLERSHKRLMPRPHWFGMVMGVAPQQQGKGLGRALLHPVLQKADAEGVPCYLETCALRNVDLYRRYGFDTIELSEIPRGGPYFWMMARQPTSSAGMIW